MGQEKKASTRPMPEYRVIDTPAALQKFVRQTAKSSMIAVDLEADSMYHYREKVCLIQMSANGRTVVIDPLQLTDLSQLRPVFADPAVCKVFHGADYDVRSLHRDFGFSIANLFDTQLASVYLGYKETGLEAVVAERFGVELDKKYQKKDWSQRPLPEDMMAYAASDVAYLIPLAKILMRELKKQARLAWVEEECALLSKVRASENNNAPLFLKFKGAGRLTPRQLAVLEELLQLRDSLARQKDRPWFKIISNAALLKIASIGPTTLQGLKKCTVLSDRQLDMYANSLLEVIKKAYKLPRPQLPKYPIQRSLRLSPKVPARVKVLRAWRDEKAEKLALDPALLFNKALIRDIAAKKPRTMEDLQEVPGIHQWQTRFFGRQLIDILKNLP